MDEDQVFVVIMEHMGQRCIWDNIKGLQDELEIWWDEREPEEVRVTFTYMSQEDYKALPEFPGW